MEATNTVPDTYELIARFTINRLFLLSNVLGLWRHLYVCIYKHWNWIFVLFGNSSSIVPTTGGIRRWWYFLSTNHSKCSKCIFNHLIAPILYSTSPESGHRSVQVCRHHSAWLPIEEENCQRPLNMAGFFPKGMPLRISTIVLGVMEASKYYTTFSQLSERCQYTSKPLSDNSIGNSIVSCDCLSSIWIKQNSDI